MKLKKAGFFLSSLLIFSVISCKKYDDFNLASTAWNPNLAVPIGNATYGVYDILAANDSSDLIVIDPVSGQLALTYRSHLTTLLAKDIIVLNNFSENYLFNLTDLNVPTQNPYNGTSNSFQNLNLTVNGKNNEEINSVYFKTGELNIDLQTNLRHDLNVLITLQDIKRNGLPITKNMTLTYGGTIPQVTNTTIDISDADATFTNNKSRIQVQISVVGKNNPIVGTETVTANLTSSNLTYHNVKGYFGQQSIADFKDSVLLKLFEETFKGNFEFTRPTVTFDVDNSFGFPVDVVLSELQTISSNTGAKIDLINYPTTIPVAAASNLGNTTNAKLVLNNSNTNNLSQLIAPTPKYFYYNANGLPNPKGKTGVENFVEENSQLDINTTVDLPLEGYAYGFTIEDTIQFNEFTGDDLNMIESVLFRLIVTNGFPVKLTAVINFVDDNYNVLFSMFDSPKDVVDPAPVDNTGKVASSVKKITDLIVKPEHIALLGKASKIIIHTEASTTNFQKNEIVKFFDDYKILVKLALQVQAKTSVN